MRDRLVTVCNKCFQASCWNGIFLCDKADYAGTIDLPIWVLERLNLEHPDYWLKKWQKKHPEEIIKKCSGIEVKIKVDYPDLFPFQAHSDDAGWDLKSKYTHILESGDFKLVYTGVRVFIPNGCMGLVFARSSLAKKQLIIVNSVGIIDHGYTGEIIVPMRNISDKTQNIDYGERIVQLIIVRFEKPIFKTVESFEKTDRGNKGFGSSGEY